MMNLYCIVARTKSGKDYYLNKLMSNRKFVNSVGLKMLVYGTTKKTHHFSNSQEYYTVIKENVPKPEECIESRTYYTLTEGEVNYFTRIADIEGKEGNFICIATTYQFEMYKYWMERQIIMGHPYKLHMIYIDTPLRTRLMHILHTVKTEDDLCEVCRRVIQERDDYERAKWLLEEISDPKNSNNVCYVKNRRFISHSSRMFNLCKIRKYIQSTAIDI